MHQGKYTTGFDLPIDTPKQGLSRDREEVAALSISQSVSQSVIDDVSLDDDTCPFPSDQLLAD